MPNAHVPAAAVGLPSPIPDTDPGTRLAPLPVEPDAAARKPPLAQFGRALLDHVRTTKFRIANLAKERNQMNAPLDHGRRALVSSVAIASMAGLPAFGTQATAVFSDAVHPDAALLDLCARFDVVHEQLQTKLDRFNELEAMYFKTRPLEPEGRAYWEGIASLEADHRAQLISPLRRGLRNYLAAEAAWRKECDVLYAAMGLREAHERNGDECCIWCDLFDEILAFRATTLEGISAKARVSTAEEPSQEMRASVIQDLLAMRANTSA